MPHKTFIPSIVVLFLFAAIGAADDLNGSFEEGRDGQPLKWELSGGIGAWEEEGHNGGRCISVTGDGKSSNYWKCPVGLTPGQIYRIDFWTKSGPDTSNGNVISGTNRVNMDWRHTQEWTHRKIIFRAPDGGGERFLKLGQWQARGPVYFDDIRLRRANWITRRWTDNVTLGQGERVHAGRFEFSAPLEEGLNWGWGLERCTADFNSNRWLFSNGSEIEFLHWKGLKSEDGSSSRLMSNAKVEVDVGYHVAGRCVVEAACEGTTWTELGEVSKVGSATFDLPDDFNRVPFILVRLVGRRDSSTNRACYFQVYGYGFSADLEGDVPDLTGETQIVMEDGPALSDGPRPFIRVTDVGQPSRGGRNRLWLSMKNSTAEAVTVLPATVVDGEREPHKPRIIPPGTHRIELSYSAGSVGAHVARIELTDAKTGAAIHGAEWEYKVPALYDSGFGYAIEAGEACDLWWAGGPYKISRTCPMPEEKRPIEIAAAKGEYEPFQLVIAPKRDLKGLRATVSNLRSKDQSEIPASAVEVCQVGYVNVTRPTDEIGCEGEWPDPLPLLNEPLDVNSKKGNQPLWFTVHVPRDAKAGEYRGTIGLSAEGWKASVPVSLTVWDFEIPRENHLKTAFGFSPGNVKRYQNLETEEEQRKVVDLYFQDFAEHRISPYDFAPFDPIRVTWPNSPDDPVKIDFAAFDKQAERYLGPDYRFTTFRLRLSGMGGGTFHARSPGRIRNWEQGTPEYEKVFADYLGQLEAHLKEKGWLDEAYAYWFDEPDPKDYDFVREGMERIHRAAPGLLRMLTEQPEPELDGVADIWCPLTPRVTPEIVAREHEKGREVWWYICTGPKGPYCTLFIDHPGIEFRMWSWQTWKTGVDGLLIWQSNYWTSTAAYPPPALQNPWKDPMSWRSGYSTPAGQKRPWGNGDGRFLYPPNRDPANDKTTYLEGPVNSIRWEMLREGIEDYEYFWLLRSLVEQAKKAGRADGSVKRAERLLEIPDSITEDQTTFTHNPRDLYEYREKLAAAILELSKAM